MRAVLSIAAVAALAGCAVNQPVDWSKADYGPYPQDYEQIVKQHMQERLKDPDSAKYQFPGKPVAGYEHIAGKTDFGWYLCPLVNAKNSYGAYTGYQQYYIMIKNGIVISSFNGAAKYQRFMVEQMCGKR